MIVILQLKYLFTPTDGKEQMQDFSLINSEARVLFTLHEVTRPISVSSVVNVNAGEFSAIDPWIDAFTIEHPHTLVWDRKKASSISAIGMSKSAMFLETKVLMNGVDTFEAIKQMVRAEFFSLAVVQLQGTQLAIAYASKAALDFSSVATNSAEPCSIRFILDGCSTIHG